MELRWWITYLDDLGFLRKRHFGTFALMAIRNF